MIFALQKGNMPEIKAISDQKILKYQYIGNRYFSCLLPLKAQ